MLAWYLSFDTLEALEVKKIGTSCLQPAQTHPVSLSVGQMKGRLDMFTILRRGDATTARRYSEDRQTSTRSCVPFLQYLPPSAAAGPLGTERIEHMGA